MKGLRWDGAPCPNGERPHRDHHSWDNDEEYSTDDKYYCLSTCKFCGTQIEWDDTENYWFYYRFIIQEDIGVEDLV